MRILDENGNLRDEAWLEATFGHVEVREAQGVPYDLLQVREEEGPLSITVTVVDSQGLAIPGLPICWSWPDAPPDERAGWDKKAQVERTDATGSVRFTMGHPSFYNLPGPGPHSVWVYGAKSPYVGGLGMVGGTNHKHLNLTFLQVGGTSTDAHWESLLAKLDYVIVLMKKRLG